MSFYNLHSLPDNEILEYCKDLMFAEHTIDINIVDVAALVDELGVRDSMEVRASVVALIVLFLDTHTFSMSDLDAMRLIPILSLQLRAVTTIFNEHQPIYIHQLLTCLTKLCEFNAAEVVGHVELEVITSAAIAMSLSQYWVTRYCTLLVNLVVDFCFHSRNTKALTDFVVNFPIKYLLTHERDLENSLAEAMMMTDCELYEHKQYDTLFCHLPFVSYVCDLKTGNTPDFWGVVEHLSDEANSAYSDRFISMFLATLPLLEDVEVARWHDNENFDVLLNVIVDLILVSKVRESFFDSFENLIWIATDRCMENERFKANLNTYIELMPYEQRRDAKWAIELSTLPDSVKLYHDESAATAAGLDVIKTEE
ncbi:hypothetical protein PCE1_004196 [Barthelona sp. PCE]